MQVQFNTIQPNYNANQNSFKGKVIMSKELANELALQKSKMKLIVDGIQYMPESYEAIQSKMAAAKKVISEKYSPLVKIFGYKNTLNGHITTTCLNDVDYVGSWCYPNIKAISFKNYNMLVNSEFVALDPECAENNRDIIEEQVLNNLLKIANSFQDFEKCYYNDELTVKLDEKHMDVIAPCLYRGVDFATPLEFFENTKEQLDQTEKWMKNNPDLYPEKLMPKLTILDIIVKNSLNNYDNYVKE